MLHSYNKEIRQILFDGSFGLEKECLRVLENGRMSHTRHPFPNDPHIVYDFCENQTEINTSVGTSIEEAVNMLQEHTDHIIRELAKLEEPELVWPFSNPPFIRNEEDIPIAIHDEKAGYARGYREYLADRYGRYKMALSGIHYNFAFSDELIKKSFELSNRDDFQEFKNELYLVLAEKLALYGWIITVLTAASPILDGSYVEKGEPGRTCFNGMASTRCSELGYWNHFAPIFDYSSISAYADSIQKYVDEGMIVAPTELYYPIRLKSPGKNNLERLKEKGVDHIEIRVVDLNPLEKAGVNVLDLKFIHLFMIFLVCTEYRPMELKDQSQAVQNYKNAAHYDLRTVKIEVPGYTTYSVVDASLKIIEAMRDFYKDYPEKIHEILDFEEAKLVDPSNRYAWKVRKEYETGFVKKGIEMAKERQKEVISCANYLESQE